MEKKMIRLLALVMVILFAFPRVDISASTDKKTEAESTYAGNKASLPKKIKGTISLSDISKKGTISISITCKDFFNAGYNYGDIVKVKILGKKYKLPFVSKYSDVDAGKPALVARSKDSNIKLVINSGNFAASYGIANKTKNEDGTFEWKFADGKKDPVKVSIWIKKQGGYTKNTDFVTKMVPLVKQDIEIGSIELRFYPDEPNIPYIGLKAYNDILGINKITVKKNKSGQYVFTGEQGAKAVADIKKGTITSDDWSRFHNPAAPYEGDMKAFRDSDSGLIRISEVKYEGDSKPVTFDLRKYDLKMYAGDQDVYMSLSLVSNMMADIATNFLVWNGEKVYYMTYPWQDSYFDTMMTDATILNKMFTDGLRPEDVVEETFKELCFTFDYFYGHPGTSIVDEALEEKGLFEALKDQGDEGISLIEELKSSDVKAYYFSLQKLFSNYLEDKGHTVLDSIENVLGPYYENTDKEALSEFVSIIYTPRIVNKSLLTLEIDAQRNELWGEEVYQEYGNTAVIRLIDFYYDIQGWEDYFAGKADIPDDTVGVTVKSLKKAENNEKIKNILFDFSINNGGQSDALMYLMILLTGNNELSVYDRINNQKITYVYEADTNLDGVIDEKDKEVIYDKFNYGLLTSKQAFSCGNLFSILMNDEGAVLLGEPTGGGSCAIQIGVMPDGLFYMFSSYQGVLVSPKGQDIESGCKTDISIPHVETIREDGYTDYDYSGYFDLKNLDDIMNKWFAEEEEKAA